jgi:5'-nucleotidase (lipoprotein e(P4) family)
MSHAKIAGLVALAAVAGFGLARQGEAKKEEPPYRGLDANLYMQLSAEYRAACLQAYTLAGERVKSTMMKPSDGPGRVVILDLDETVFDNRAYQSTMLRTAGGGFDAIRWLNWEGEVHAGEVRWVPGAKEFLRLCKEHGVPTFFISNRTETNRAGTKAALAKLGIDVPDEQLLLNKSASSSDKTERRKQVTDKFHVILNVGDNLRDFDERFKFDKAKGSDGRNAEVDATKENFGSEWIILPNPAYGEWAKACGNGLKDLDLLSPSVSLTK